MNYRKFDMNIASAADVVNVREMFKMRVYAKISIAGNSETEKRTPVDYNGGINPTWNFPLSYWIPDWAIQNDDASARVQIDLYCERTLGDRYIGGVSIPLKKLFLDEKIKGMSCSTYCVLGEAREMGTVNFSHHFGDVEKLVFPQQSQGPSGSRWEMVAGNVVGVVISNVVEGTVSAVVDGAFGLSAVM
ncbi:C2 domain [Dillenia turbinata]|uniref:C2 domain n=1 Tax=Dillenia turbinata TaxID=194707 RepID=A0AAN8W1L4_9MAGN